MGLCLGPSSDSAPREMMTVAFCSILSDETDYLAVVKALSSVTGNVSHCYYTMIKSFVLTDRRIKQ